MGRHCGGAARQPPIRQRVPDPKENAADRSRGREHPILTRVECKSTLPCSSLCQQGLSWTTGLSSASAGARSRLSCRAPIFARCITNPRERPISLPNHRRTGHTSSEHALGGRPAKWRGNSGGLCGCAVHLSCGGSRNAKAWEMEMPPAEADATQARRLHSPSGHQWSPAW